MRFQTSGRETGNALIVGVLVTLILFGLVASMVISSTTSAHAVSDASDQLAAMYVAQAGLARAKQELALGVDTEGDDLGTVAGETQGGRYQVLATNLGANLYQLDAVGTARAGSSSLREIVEVAPSLKFPPGAMSVLGAVDRTRIQLKKDFGLVLDGGDSAALSISDPLLFNGIAQEFVAAIESGALPLDNLTGAVTTPMDINGVTENVPLVNNTEYDSALEDMDAFYDQLLAGVGNLLPTATKVSGLDGRGDLLFGTPESPALVHLDEPIFLHGGSITGHGTLIVSKQLRLGLDTRLDWTGDVIVIGDDKGEADLRVEGDFTVNGNVLILGEGGMSSWFRIGQEGRVTINGSFFVATGYSSNNGKKASIRNGNELVVNGLMLLLGSKVDLWSEAGSDLNVNGMAVLGIRENADLDADGNPLPGDLSLRFEGDVEMHRDDAQIQTAVNGILEMSARLNLDAIPILDYSVVRRAWIQTYEADVAAGDGS